MTKQFKTREEWLTAANIIIDKELFAPLDRKWRLPKKWRVTCGFPATGATRAKSPRIGECWCPSASKSAHAEIIVSMLIDEPVRVLDILVHESVHAVVGHECGHHGEFVRLAKAVGLEGPMTATVAGPALTKKLSGIAKRLGAYPHSSLRAMLKDRKKQTTRMLKCTCSECGYVARTTSKWIAEAGAPLCPCNAEPMEVEA